MLWEVRSVNGRIHLDIESERGLTCRLRKDADGTWRGRWKQFEKMPIELTPVDQVNKRPPGLQPAIIFRGPINGYTGYGLHSCQIIADLAEAGYDVLVRPMEFDDRFGLNGSGDPSRFVYGAQAGAWELLLHPPNCAPTRLKKTLYFTMWEATQLPEKWVGYLNQAECVVVPCQWNARHFRESGVVKPIEILPLGIKEDIFAFRPMDLNGPCVFGAAAKVRGGGERKGLNEMVELFRQAFPDNRDVRLKVKCFPDCGLAPANDPRVEITAAYLTEQELAAWYGSLTCFVSLSRSEGWGLMPHQAMAVGRPCIAMCYSGQAEYLRHDNAYCVSYREVPAAYNYAGTGSVG